VKSRLERYAQIGAGIAGLTIILIGVINYATLNSLSASNRWVDHTVQVIGQIELTRSSARVSENAARSFALTGDASFLTTLRDSVAYAKQHAQEVRRLTSDNPRQQNRLDRYEILLDQHSQALNDWIDKRRLQVASTTTTRNAAGDAPSDAGIEALGQEMQNEETSLLQGRRQVVAQITETTRIVTTIGSVFSLLILCLAGTMIQLDLRRQQKLETDLGYEKDLFATLMNRIPDRVYFKDPESRFLRINSATARHMGLPDPADAIGKSDADFYSPDHAGSAREDERHVFESGQAMIEKEELETSIGGHEAWVLTSKLPLVDRKGSTVGTFGITRDITASKQAEKELESANSRLAGWNSQLELRNREILLLSEMGELLQTCVNETEAESILGQFARDLCPALSGSLSMIKASRNLVETTASWGSTSGLVSVFGPEDCWALRRGRPHGSGRSGGRLKCAHIDPEFGGTFICVPMMAHGETLGVLHLLRENGEDLTESELRLSSMVAEQIGQAIANLRLREALKAQSIRDPLTGLFNRRYMEESLERELHRADTHNGTVGAIMIDLDHFKQFNDSFGHDGGDSVLRKFSELLHARTKKEDIVCRYGGEEFLIILPGASLRQARDFGEGLLEATRNIAVMSRGRELGPVSISAGIALYPEHGKTMGALIRAADDALYRAKMRGRNRVVLSHDESVNISTSVSIAD